MENKWYVIAGGPCSGKTTIINELERRGYAISHEKARAFIDAELAKGKTIEEIRANPVEFQMQILQLKIAHETNLPREQIMFFDRGIPDTRAYLAYQGLSENEFIREAVDGCSYRGVFLLDPLPLVNDYARTETAEEQAAIHEAMEAAYGTLKSPVIKVPALPLDERTDFILSKIL